MPGVQRHHARKHGHLRVGRGFFEDTGKLLSRFYSTVKPAAVFIRDEIIKPLIELALESGVPQELLKKELGSITTHVTNQLPAGPLADKIKKKTIEIVDANKNKIVDEMVRKLMVTGNLGPKKKDVTSARSAELLRSAENSDVTPTTTPTDVSSATRDQIKAIVNVVKSAPRTRRGRGFEISHASP